MKTYYAPTFTSPACGVVRAVGDKSPWALLRRNLQLVGRRQPLSSETAVGVSVLSVQVDG